MLVSMPGDTIKTYLQTHTAGRMASSPLSQVALFFETGGWKGRIWGALVRGELCTCLEGERDSEVIVLVWCVASLAGKAMVKQRGMQSLYLGVVPRLLQQVPSSTICWYSVEACQKALAPYTAPDEGGNFGHGGGH